MSSTAGPKAEPTPDPEGSQIAQDGQSAQTMFLDPKTYRRRRLMDAVRALPVLGMLLWMVPLLWSSGEGAAAATDPVPTSRALLYIFVVWGALILVGVALWWRVGRALPENVPSPKGAPKPAPKAERTEPWPR